MRTVRLKQISFFSIFAIAVAMAGSTSADIILSEDFESPDVDSGQSTGFTSGAIPTGWVGATQGFGASRRGIADESAGAFTDPVGEQAFAFRYTNSGLTSAEGVIGALTLGATYTLAFDIATDSGATPFRAQLLAIPVGVTAPARNDVRNLPAGSSLLGSLNGDAASAILGDRQSLVFSPDPGTHAGLVGYDVAVRFLGATSSAMIDNITVDVVGVVPEPASLSLLALGATLLCFRRRLRAA